MLQRWGNEWVEVGTSVKVKVARGIGPIGHQCRDDRNMTVRRKFTSSGFHFLFPALTGRTLLDYELPLCVLK